MDFPFFLVVLAVLFGVLLVGFLSALFFGSPNVGSMTARAWWILFLAALMAGVGLPMGHPVLAILGLTLLLWLAVQSVLFAIKARWVVRGLRLTREVRDDRVPVHTLWARRVFEVRLTVSLDSILALPYLALQEQVPYGLDLTEGQPRGEGPISATQPLHVRYKVKAGHPGTVRFEGVRVQIADLGGLFHHAAYIHLPAILRVLPSLVDAEGKTASAKRFNLMPPPGIHRLLRPGSGSELLELRDYIPGDPPKTIAWKVSARRDKLITKEYENEVPVRCTLFVDVSRSVRLGPPGQNALTRLVEIAAGFAQANTASRDMTGLCLFDEKETTILKPARNRRHLVQVFDQLAAAAGRPAAAGRGAVDALLPLACAFAEEHYPELWSQDVNYVPNWLPFFIRTPSHWVMKQSTAGRVFRTILLTFLAVFYWLLVALPLEGALADVYNGIPKEYVEEFLPPYDIFVLMWFVVFLCGFPFWMLFWRDFVPLFFQPRARRITRQRKKIAAILSHLYQLGPGGIELLSQDDRPLGKYLERFLNDHHVPHTPKIYDNRGRFLFASQEKIDVLARALLRAVGKGHDNELFALLVDVVELERDLGPLVQAVKVALARHHHVMLVLPWPLELAPPSREPPTEQDALKGKKGKKERPRVPIARMTPGEFRDYVMKLMTRRYHRAYHRVRRTFSRMQVPVVCAASDDPVPLLLERVDRLRGVRRRRR